MNRRYRKTIIAGNWKMNKTPSQTKNYAEEIRPLLPRGKWCEIVLCVPSVDLTEAIRDFKGTRVCIGAQHVHYLDHGAYTGEVSAPMLKDAGAKYVIVGHSERRQYYNDTDAKVNRRIKAALENGLKPIVCVGETKEQREHDLTMPFIEYQVSAALFEITPEQMRHVVIAYEPLWAIGTGVNATAEQANEVCEWIRTVIRKKYGARIARAVSILYGGSMKPGNASDLLAQPDVDGGLIGGASLKPADFVEIINAANQD